MDQDPIGTNHTQRAVLVIIGILVIIALTGWLYRYRPSQSQQTVAGVVLAAGSKEPADSADCDMALYDWDLVAATQGKQIREISVVTVGQTLGIIMVCETDLPADKAQILLMDRNGQQTETTVSIIKRDGRSIVSGRWLTRPQHVGSYVIAVTVGGRIMAYGQFVLVGTGG